MLGIYNFGYSVVNRELPHHPSWNINQSDEKGGKARCLLYYQHNLKLGIEAVNLKNDSWGILEKIEAAKNGGQKSTGNIHDVTGDLFLLYHERILTFHFCFVNK